MQKKIQGIGVLEATESTLTYLLRWGRGRQTQRHPTDLVPRPGPAFPLSHPSRHPL